MTEPKASEEEYDDGKLHRLYDEIVAEQKSFRRRPPKDFASVNEYTDGTVLSFLKDLAHYVREQDSLVQDLFDRVEELEGDADPATQGTQFTPEDALDFKILVTFAREQAKQILASNVPEIAEGTEAHGQATMIVSKADAALELIEESTLEDDDDDDGGEGEDDGDDGDEEAAGSAGH